MPVVSCSSVPSYGCTTVSMEYPTSRATEMRKSMEPLPIVTHAEYRGDYRIRVTFSDGLTSTVDFADWLYGPIFEPLKDRGYFQRFFIEGGTVSWPNGADIAPETLYERAQSSEAA